MYCGDCGCHCANAGVAAPPIEPPISDAPAIQRSARRLPRESCPVPDNRNASEPTLCMAVLDVVMTLPRSVATVPGNPLKRGRCSCPSGVHGHGDFAVLLWMQRATVVDGLLIARRRLGDDVSWT